MSAPEISEYEFSRFQKMLYDIAGISLSSAKKPLVVSRLSKRLREYRLDSFGDYLKLLELRDFQHEVQTAVDLLTTNETYFFREPNHFVFLKEQAEQARRAGSEPFRVWSAACSSGQEPYSIAMVLQDCLGQGNWEVMASDISTLILEKAKAGKYPIAQAENIAPEYLSRFCLKGIGSQAGTFLMDKTLRDRVAFFHCNLNAALPRIGLFNIIFLRNVMIYFDVETKQKVVSKLLSLLRPGGYLFIGHSESLHGISKEMEMVRPAIFRKPVN